MKLCLLDSKSGAVVKFCLDILLVMGSSLETMSLHMQGKAVYNEFGHNIFTIYKDKDVYNVFRNNVFAYTRIWQCTMTQKFPWQ